MSSVDADLVGPAGADRYFDQGRDLPKLLDRRERTHGLQTICVHLHHSLAPLLQIGFERQIKRFGPEGPAPTQQCQIGFLHLALTEQSVELAQRRTTLSDHQAAARLSIESMDQLQVLQLRLHSPQSFNHPEAQAASAMYGDAGGLVDNQEITI